MDYSMIQSFYATDFYIAINLSKYTIYSNRSNWSLVMHFLVVVQLFYLRSFRLPCFVFFLWGTWFHVKTKIIKKQGFFRIFWILNSRNYNAEIPDIWPFSPTTCWCWVFVTRETGVKFTTFCVFCNVSMIC